MCLSLSLTHLSFLSQSDTAGMTIPEIDLELNPGTLGGRFTTLEGLLNQVYEELDEKVFANGDAAVPGATDEMAKFLAQLKLVSFLLVPINPASSYDRKRHAIPLLATSHRCATKRRSSSPNASLTRFPPLHSCLPHRS